MAAVVLVLVLRRRRFRARKVASPPETLSSHDAEHVNELPVPSGPPEEHIPALWVYAATSEFPPSYSGRELEPGATRQPLEGPLEEASSSKYRASHAEPPPSPHTVLGISEQAGLPDPCVAAAAPHRGAVLQLNFESLGLPGFRRVDETHGGQDEVHLAPPVTSSPRSSRRCAVSGEGGAPSSRAFESAALDCTIAASTAECTTPGRLRRARGQQSDHSSSPSVSASSALREPSHPFSPLASSNPQPSHDAQWGRVLDWLLGSEDDDAALVAPSDPAINGLSSPVSPDQIDHRPTHSGSELSRLRVVTVDDAAPPPTDASLPTLTSAAACNDMIVPGPDAAAPVPPRASGSPSFFPRRGHHHQAAERPTAVAGAPANTTRVAPAQATDDELELLSDVFFLPSHVPARQEAEDGQRAAGAVGSWVAGPQLSPAGVVAQHQARSLFEVDFDVERTRAGGTVAVATPHTSSARGYFSQSPLRAGASPRLLTHRSLSLLSPRPLSVTRAPSQRSMLQPPVAGLRREPSLRAVAVAPTFTLITAGSLSGRSAAQGHYSDAFVTMLLEDNEAVSGVASLPLTPQA